MTEHDHQVALIRWAKLQSKAIPELGLLFAIPNGGLRNIRVAQKLKAEGVKAGIPDLMLAYPKGTHAGLFIEMKEPKKGKLSDIQKDVCERLLTAGYHVKVCYGWESARETILDYLGYLH